MAKKTQVRRSGAMNKVQIWALIRALVAQWQAEGDTAPPQELMGDAILHIRWKLEAR